MAKIQKTEQEKLDKIKTLCDEMGIKNYAFIGIGVQDTISKLKAMVDFHFSGESNGVDAVFLANALSDACSSLLTATLEEIGKDYKKRI